ncbi:MAG: hypothetical protein ACI8TA_002121 [Cyclobacteriaceae bacterium]|jgi:hypothetical protein
MRKSYLVSIVFSLFQILICASCNTYAHFATYQKVLDFNAAKEFVVSASQSKNTLSGYLAYSLTDNFGISTGASSTGRNYFEPFTDNFLIDHELAYYQNLNQNLIVGMNLGMGYGRQVIDAYGEFKTRK